MMCGTSVDNFRKDLVISYIMQSAECAIICIDRKQKYISLDDRIRNNSTILLDSHCIESISYRGRVLLTNIAIRHLLRVLLGSLSYPTSLSVENTSAIRIYIRHDETLRFRYVNSYLRSTRTMIVYCSLLFYTLYIHGAYDNLLGKWF